MARIKKRGITLVVLVITLVIILVLSTTIIINMSRNNSISNSKKTVFLSDLQSFQTELDLYILKEQKLNLGKYDPTLLQADSTSVTYNGNQEDTLTIDKIITSLNKKYSSEEFEIVNGKLIYKGTDTIKQEWAASTDVLVQTVPLRIDIYLPAVTAVDKGENVTYTVKASSNASISNVNLKDNVYVLNEYNLLINPQPQIAIQNVSGTDIDEKRSLEITINTSNLLEGKYKIKIASGAITDSNNLSNEIEVISDVFEVKDIIIPEAPSILVTPTVITKSVTVSMSSLTIDATIEYSIDDKATWQTYTGPFDIVKKMIVYAKAIRKGRVSEISNKNITNIDNICPSVSISDPSKNIAKLRDTIIYTVTYNDSNFKESTLKPEDVILNKTGTATGEISVTGSSNSRIVTISQINGVGTLGITIPAATGVDTALNESLESLPSKTVQVDNTVPVIESITTNSSGYKKVGDQISLFVNYSESVEGIAPTMNISFGTGSAKALTTGTVNGKIVTYAYTLQNGDNGKLSINSYVGGTLKDFAGNDASVQLTGFNAQVIADTVAPTIQVSNPSKTIAKYNDSVSYTVTYSDTNFKESTLKDTDVVLNKTGTATGVVTVSGTDNTREVLISNIIGNGTLSISLNPGTAVDLSSNLSESFGPSNVFTADAVPVTVTDIALKYSSGTAYKKVNDAISIEVTYSKPVTGTVQNLNIAFGTGETKVLTNGIIASNKVSYSYTIQNGDNGDLIIKSLTGGTLVESTGNTVNSANLPVATGSIIADTSIPTFSKIEVIPTGYKKGGTTASIKVTYSEPVIGNSPSITYVFGTGPNINTGNANIATPSDTYIYTITLPSNQNGVLTLKSYSGSTLVDLAGNSFIGTLPAITENLILDTIAPTNTLSAPSKTAAKITDIVTYTLTYVDTNFSLSTLTPSNITLIKTGTANAAVDVSGEGATKTITLSNISGEGTLGMNIIAGTGIDLAGNLTSAIPSSTTFKVDNSAPNVAFTTNGAIDVTTASTKITVADVGNSGLNTLEYVWDTQNTIEPTDGWTTFTSGNTITKTSTRGTYYLWVRVTDLAGNVNLTKTSPFIINSIEGYENGTNTIFSYTGDFLITSTDHYSGKYCYTNKNIGDSQTSSSTFQINDIPDDGYQYYLTYYYKTSTENNYDYLRVYVNNVVTLSASGATNWTYAETKLNPLSNTVNFEYSKDSSVSKNKDSIYIDNVYIQKNGLIAPTFTTISSQTGKAVIQINYSSASVVKEYSTDGLNWITYTGPLTITTNNTTIYARSSDNNSVQSTTSTYTITNI